MSRPSPLVTSVGWAHLAHGLVFVALGAWCLISGTDLVLKSLNAGQELGKFADEAGGQGKDVAAGADMLGKGFAGLFAALVGVAAGCLIANGLPLCLVGAGVINRWGWARVVALLLGLLSGVQGLGLLAGSASPPNIRIIGAVLTAFAVLTWVGLLTARARDEFSGMKFDPAPGGEMGYSPGMVAVGLLLVAVPVGGVIYVAMQQTKGPDVAKDRPAVAAKVAELHAAVALDERRRQRARPRRPGHPPVVRRRQRRPPRRAEARELPVRLRRHSGQVRRTGQA